MLILANFDFWTLGLPTPVALAAVAVFGYLFGCRVRRAVEIDRTQARRELKRAKAVIRQLESISNDVRASLATHHSSILRFKERIGVLSSSEVNGAWKDLCEEAENMLTPTLKLAGEIAHAYDEIRQQTNLLMTFTEVRTDPLTGLSNRRGLDESLKTMFAMMTRYSTPFSLVIFDIDHFKQVNDQGGHLHGDDILQQVARLLDGSVRDTDVVVRYGGEEFVVMMPATDLDGAVVFCDRVRQSVEEQLTVTISGGVAQALDGDNPRTLLARADSALYSAKSQGRNRIFRHTGRRIEPFTGAAALASASAMTGVVVESRASENSRKACAEEPREKQGSEGAAPADANGKPADPARGTSSAKRNKGAKPANSAVSAAEGEVEEEMTDDVTAEETRTLEAVQELNQQTQAQSQQSMESASH